MKVSTSRFCSGSPSLITVSPVKFHPGSQHAGTFNFLHWLKIHLRVLCQHGWASCRISRPSPWASITLNLAQFLLHLPTSPVSMLQVLGLSQCNFTGAIP